MAWVILHLGYTGKTSEIYGTIDAFWVFPIPQQIIFMKKRSRNNSSKFAKPLLIKWSVRTFAHVDHPPKYQDLAHTHFPPPQKKYGTKGAGAIIGGSSPSFTSGGDGNEKDADKRPGGGNGGEFVSGYIWDGMEN